VDECWDVDIALISPLPRYWLALLGVEWPQNAQDTICCAKEADE
jgi:hypothetical protein